MQGAGMWLGGSLSSMTIYNSTISQNMADLLGGGISLTGSMTNFSVEKTNFLGNYGSSSGGAIFMAQSMSIPQVVLKNSVFSGNYAFYGGVCTISAKIQNMSVSNCNHYGNYAYSSGSGGTYYVDKAKVKLMGLYQNLFIVIICGRAANIDFVRLCRTYKIGCNSPKQTLNNFDTIILLISKIKNKLLLLSSTRDKN